MALGAAGAVVGGTSLGWAGVTAAARLRAADGIAVTGATYGTVGAGAPAVGYLLGSDARVPTGRTGVGRGNASHASNHGRVVAADSLQSGDRALQASGAFVTIRGLELSPKGLLRPPLGALGADILFDYTRRGRVETVHCHAWSYACAPVENSSPAIGMQVPIDRTTGLRLVIEEQDAASGPLGRAIEWAFFGRVANGAGTRSAELRFTTGRQRGLPRLRRGTYFIAAPGPHGTTRPDWGDFRFEPSAADPQTGRLVRPTPFGPEPADFDYLVVTIDDARPAPGDTEQA
jgi:hypothetical protein